MTDSPTEDLATTKAGNSIRQLTRERRNGAFVQFAGAGTLVIAHSVG